MKNKLADALENSTFVMVTDIERFIKKLSLKNINYKGERLKESPYNFEGFHEILSLTKPTILGEINELFLQAGVDIITTNTAKANRHFLKDFELEDVTYELNFSSAKLVRERVAKYTKLDRTKPRYAAAYIAPIDVNLDAEYMKSIYSEQIKALLAGKINIIFLQKFDSEKAIDAALNALNDILIRRNKSQEIILTVTKPELKDWLLDKTKMQKYEKIEVVAVGMSEFDEAQYEELKNKCPYKIFVYEDEEKIENSKLKYSENKYFDIIGLNSVAQHSSIKAFIDFFENN